MCDVEPVDSYFPQRVAVHASVQKQEVSHCISDFQKQGLSPESLYLNNHFHERLKGVRADGLSRSTILCIPIPDNGTIPTILNNVFNIEAVSKVIGVALGTGERPTPEVDVAINGEHAFFEAEILEGDEVGEDNRQEIRATGLLKFFDLIPDWLASRLDASIVPFEDRWLATLDIALKSTGHIMISPAPLGMELDPITKRRIIITSFMNGTVNTNEGVPYPMDVEFDYDPILGALDEDIDIPGAGQKNIIAINEIYDSGDTVDEQIRTLQSAGREQESFMNAVVSEIIPDNKGKDEFVEDDELLEVELTLSGHRKEEIDLVLEQQVVVYVDPKHLDYARSQLTKSPVFLSADVLLSFGLYNPGAPPEGKENIEKNDFLQFYLNIKQTNGETLNDSVVLSGGVLYELAKMKLPDHKLGYDPNRLSQDTSAPIEKISNSR